MLKRRQAPVAPRHPTKLCRRRGRRWRRTAGNRRSRRRDGGVHTCTCTRQSPRRPGAASEGRRQCPSPRAGPRRKKCRLWGLAITRHRKLDHPYRPADIGSGPRSRCLDIRRTEHTAHACMCTCMYYRVYIYALLQHLRSRSKAGNTLLGLGAGWRPRPWTGGWQRARPL